MLSPHIENLVIKLLITISNKEKEVEINRQLLGKNIDFDVFQLYCFLDKEKKNYITSLDLMEFLHKNGVYPNQLEMEFIILFYDKNADNVLSYTEFLNMILSENNLCLRKICKERIGSLSYENNIPNDIGYLFISLLEKEIELIRIVNRIINEIKGQCDFNFHDIYHLLIGCQSYINKDTLRTFLLNHDITFSEDDLDNIMKRLDLNEDHIINFFEFHKFFCFADSNCRCTFNIKNCCLCNPNLIPNNNSNIILKEISPSLSLRGPPVKGCDNNYISSNNCNDCIQFNNQYYNNIDDKNNDSYIENSFNISQNLLLRKKPERHFKNKKNNTINENNLEYNNNIDFLAPNQYSNNENYCHICHNSPCKCIEISLRKAENEFLIYLRECIKLENKIEKAKIDLSLRSDFNVEDAFKIFERENRKYITDADLIYGLNTLEVYPSEKDILLIKRRINPKKTENIIFSDFSDFILPFEKDYRNMIEKRVCSNYTVYNYSNVFFLTTRNYFSNFFNVIIECENKIDNLRNLLCDVRSYIEILFNNIDQNNLGFINDFDLNCYLKSKGIFANDIENCLLFKRIDKNKDGKLECWELNEEFQIT